MLGKNFSYRGVAFPWTSAQGQSNGWYADVDWSNVPTENTNQPRTDYHGVISFPTLSRGRIIEVSGQVFSASKETRGTVRSVLDTLFRLEDFPQLGEGFYPLTFEDDNGDDWSMQCKVASAIRYINSRSGPIIDFTVTLFNETGLITSQSINEVTGIYGQYNDAGVALPSVMPFAMSGNLNPLSATNDGTISANAIITIEGDIINPRVYHVASGRYFGLDITVASGETLIINSETLTAEKDGVNVLSDRQSGSDWVYVIPSTNEFILTGDDFDFADQSKATIKVEWYHTKLT